MVVAWCDDVMMYVWTVWAPALRRAEARRKLRAGVKVGWGDLRQTDESENELELVSTPTVKVTAAAVPSLRWSCSASSLRVDASTTVRS